MDAELESESIEDRFVEFLKDVYEDEIGQVVSKGSDSLVVDFKDLHKFDTELAERLLNNPEEMVEKGEEALNSIPLSGEDDLNLRFRDLPDTEVVEIRNLRSKHLGKFISIHGIVKRSSEVRPEVVSAKFECKSCGNVIEKEQSSSKLKSPYSCSCGSKKFKVKEKNLVDVQLVTVEESPEDIEGSEQPRQISCYLREDLVDPDFQKRVMPGNKIEVTGLLQESPMEKSSKRYELFMEANFVEPVEREFGEIEIDQETEEKILELSENPDIFDMVTDTIAPSIHGMKKVKKSIVLQLFSGVRKVRADGTVTRGDIHNLMIGEPGTAKSMLLSFVSELAPKGRYVVGKSATGAGITASAVRDEMTGGFALEAGALVLANKGICGVDEIDKMSREDRSSMHEAMEQQTITVSKANIQATLQSRTSILAAGNPKYGRFDPYKPIGEQINISETLLSRFDLIFPVKDVPDPEQDKELANHVLKMHKDPEEHTGPIDFDLLTKYIAYSKRNCKPDISQEAEEKIKEFYVRIRKKGSEEGEEGSSSVPISARQLEALIRMSEASAKVRLDEKVRKKDAKQAIDLLTYTLKQVGVDPETGEFDIDRIETGITSTKRNKIRQVMDIIDSLSEEVGEAVPIEDVIAEAEDAGISDADSIIQKLTREGELFEPKHGHVQKI